MNSLEEHIFLFNKTHLIFDFDKTIFKLLLDWDQYFNNIENELISTDRQLYFDYQSDLVSWCEMQNLYVKKYGERMQKLFISNNKQSDKKLFKSVIPNIQIIDLIKKTENAYMYIWSSNTEHIILNLLKQNQILDKFDKIICRDNLKYLKPDSEGFFKIYDPKISLNQYILIGDSKNDSGAASASNINYFHVDYFEK